MEKENKPKIDLSNRGYSYETLPDGRKILKFKAKIHGLAFTQKLILPKGIDKLEPFTEQVFPARKV